MRATDLTPLHRSTCGFSSFTLSVHLTIVRGACSTTLVVALSHADAALTLARGSGVGVLFCELVPLITAVHRDSDSCQVAATQEVYLTSSSFEMRWVDASVVPAEVISVLGRQDTKRDEVAHTMCGCRSPLAVSAFDVEDCVTGLLEVTAAPQPATSLADIADDFALEPRLVALSEGVDGQRHRSGPGGWTRRILAMVSPCRNSR